MEKVIKYNDEEQLVTGWANVSVKKDGNYPKDWEGDIIPTDVLEDAAIDFMLYHRGSGEMHKGSRKGIVVESIVFTKSKMEALGIPEGTVHEGWFITVKLNDKETFEKVKSGEYSMFSIQGRARRAKI